jgi:hypothetical protein
MLVTLLISNSVSLIFWFRAKNKSSVHKGTKDNSSAVPPKFGKMPRLLPDNGGAAGDWPELAGEPSIPCHGELTAGDSPSLERQKNAIFPFIACNENIYNTFSRI